MDYSEKWGKDVDEAVRLALVDLKATIDEVNVIVLEESSKGFFGLGSKLAKVRVEKKKKVEEKLEVKAAPSPTLNPEPKKEQREQKEQTEGLEREKPAKKEHGHRQERRQERAPKQPREEKSFEIIDRERPADLQPVDSHPALDFIKDITAKMGLILDITGMKNESSLYIDIEGKDSGTVIGKRGQTLDSIQYLASLVANKEKEKEKYIRVVVDAESYRCKRERTLEQLADRLAGKVIRTKKSVRLEPMNPYERKVIHATLQANPKVTTRSEGEEPYRRVIIEIK